MLNVLRQFEAMSPSLSDQVSFYIRWQFDGHDHARTPDSSKSLGYLDMPVTRKQRDVEIEEGNLREAPRNVEELVPRHAW
jgi:hypothetical protein